MLVAGGSDNVCRGSICRDVWDDAAVITLGTGGVIMLGGGAVREVWVKWSSGGIKN